MDAGALTSEQLVGLYARAVDYEQASRRRKTPELTPPLPGERFDY